MDSKLLLQLCEEQELKIIKVNGERVVTRNKKGIKATWKFLPNTNGFKMLRSEYDLNI